MTNQKKKILAIILILPILFSYSIVSSQAAPKYAATKAGVQLAMKDCSKKVLIPENSDKSQDWADISRTAVMAESSYNFYMSRIMNCVESSNPSFICVKAIAGHLCAWSRNTPNGFSLDQYAQRYFVGLKNSKWCKSAGVTVEPLYGLKNFCK